MYTNHLWGSRQEHTGILFVPIEPSLVKYDESLLHVTPVFRCMLFLLNYGVYYEKKKLLQVCLTLHFG